MVEDNIDKNRINVIHFKKNNFLNITLSDCHSDQIKIYSRNKIFYHCENPICHSDCPVNNGSAICIPGLNNKNINNRKYNQCQCTSGWTGENCNTKVFAYIE